MISPLSTNSPAEPIDVMLVDDSAVVRGLISRWLDPDTGIRVVGSAHNGKDAIRRARESRPHVIVLDIEMPEMDGLTAIPQLLEVSPGVKIIMASTLTQRNAEISMRALSSGAADYLPKPETGGLTGAADFKRLLIEKIHALGAAAQRRRAASGGAGAMAGRASPAAPNAPSAPRNPPSAAPASSPAPSVRKALTPVSLVPYNNRRREVLVIGSSTGGPEALKRVFTVLSAAKPSVPILIGQHMPPMFTAILGEHLTRLGVPAAEARDGEPVQAGRIYIAPGDWHMRVVRRAGAVSIALDQGPAVNYCRPSVDPLFQSVADVYGASALAVVLTGMGQDGRDGARLIGAAGGQVIVQDEASSTVWGMPGAVANAGLANTVLSLDDMGQGILKALAGVKV